MMRKMERRPPPNLNRSPMEGKRAALATRSDATRTATADRFLRAYEMLDELTAALDPLPFTQQPAEKPIGSLVESAEAMSGCATIIQAMLLTDFRAALNSEILVKPAVPSVWCHVTRFCRDGEPQLYGVRAREFVVLLATATCSSA